VLKLPIALSAALALHAAGAVSLVVLAHPRGAQATTLGGVTETIEVESVTPSVHEDERSPIVHASPERRAARGESHAPAHAAVASAAKTSDVAPDPAPPIGTPDAPPVEPVRFQMRLGAQTGGGSSFGTTTTQASSGEIASEADVTERAAKIAGPAPRYPSEAIARGVELGSPLPFEIVVDESGHVVSTRALRHAGYGFDEAAIAALRAYRFTPAKRNGRSVAVRMTWTIDFRFN
jgi:periplasmic protein TonB